MATSGTIGTTNFTVAQLLEHAFRRCGVPPSKITPEDEQTARESLYMLIVSLASRGINLWCVEKNLLGLYTNQGIYTLPAGTLDVLNWIYSTPSEVTVDATTTTASSITRQLDAATTAVRYGFKPTAAFTGTVTLAGSDDDLTYTTIQTKASATWALETWYWYDIDPSVEYTYYKLTASVPATFTEFYLATSVRDINIARFNRDDWANQPNKTRTASPSTNVYFEKLVTPQFTLWPVPDTDYNHVSIWRHREIQDVGDLTNELEIPSRQFEPIVWQLALRVASEVPGADGRLQFLMQMADKFMLEGDLSETDGAPMYLAPQISVYTA